jgi:uncharacterized low-complexity protein
MNGIYWLGVDQPAPDASAWEAMLTALRDKMSESWARAESAYVTLKSVREKLGLPFVDDSQTEADSAAKHGAWTTELDVEAQDLHAMTTLIVNALTDAIAGKREVFYNDKGDLAIKQLPADIIVLDQDPQGVPILVQGPAATTPGQPAGHASAPIGVGIPTLVWVATASASVLALPAYFIVDAAANALTDVAEQKTVKTVAEKSYECVQSGKCTADDAAKINESVFAGAAGIRLAKAKEAEAGGKPSSDWASTVKVLGLVALGLAGIYFVVRLIPAGGFSGGKTKALPVRALPARALPALPAHDNPRNRAA